MRGGEGNGRKKLVLKLCTNLKAYRTVVKLSINIYMDSTSLNFLGDQLN